MERSVRIVLRQAVLSLGALLLSCTLFAQTTPELVFRNPTLEKGTAGQDGAQYRFSNITTGVDGILKIKKRSGSTVQLVDIDLYKDAKTGQKYGWDKALQPQLGIDGDVPKNKTWWMQFELDFVKTGTSTSIKLQNFVATSLDIDGDGASIREFTQMNKMKTMSFSSLTYLNTGTTLSAGSLSALDDNGDGADHSFNLTGTDKMILGPVTNFTDIDTSATAVMATYNFENKDAITFVIGASSGASTSNAGIRLNSLWFKSFSLAPQPSLLPVKLETFSATHSGDAIVLNWKTESEKDFSHFVIERSVGGKSYSDIAVVFSAGGNSENEYSYKDKTASLSAGVIYYRLRMIDNDGSIDYSPVSVVHLKETAGTVITAYPNPATNSIQVDLPGAWQSKTVRLKLYNSTGIVTLDKELKNAAATTTLTVSQLPPGFYIIQALCNGETAQQRLLKN